LSDPDLQNHIDKAFEQYKNRFRDFEILLTVVIGSGVVILAVPLGQYYFMYIELQDNVQKLVDILDEIFRNSLAPAGNMTAIVVDLNASRSQANKTTSEIATSVSSINSSLSSLANNLSAVLNIQQDRSLEQLIETINSTQNTTNQLSANFSGVTKPSIISQNANQSLTSVISNVSAIANDTKHIFIVPNLIDALKQFNTSRTEINDFVESWKSLETPFGELPIGLTNLLAILPVGLVVGYVICILSLDHAIRARERLHHLYHKYYNLNIDYSNIDYDKEITTLAPIWLDPINKSKVSKLKKIAQFLVLVIPIILIFSLSVNLILNIWFILEPHLIFAGEAYTNSLDLLKSLLTNNSVEFNESDLVIGELPLFFNSSGSFYKDIYLKLYVIVIPFFLVIVIVLHSYFRYSIPQRRPHA
jgi:hypothetical protein